MRKQQRPWLAPRQCGLAIAAAKAFRWHVTEHAFCVICTKHLSGGGSLWGGAPVHGVLSCARGRLQAAAAISPCEKMTPKKNIEAKSNIKAEGEGITRGGKGGKPKTELRWIRYCLDCRVDFELTRSRRRARRLGAARVGRHGDRSGRPLTNDKTRPRARVGKKP